MQKTIDQLQYWIIKVPELFHVMTAEEIAHRPAAKKWSKKEIVGHLCDSAIVNLERLINIQYKASPYVVTTYDQVRWVELQGYQEMPIEAILQLWTSLNKKIIYVLENIAEKSLELPIVMNQQHLTLASLIQDYVQHLEHHIQHQICET
ncbi:DinB family protein [Lysinibacillus sp. 1P01SD]|uniref:DinB family protein n=1 Tax=Lysinibacillus sp. 1P01SD TaxID=3132285 RepID=UPI0039A2AB70